MLIDFIGVVYQFLLINAQGCFYDVLLSEGYICSNVLHIIRCCVSTLFLAWPHSTVFNETQRRKNLMLSCWMAGMRLTCSTWSRGSTCNLVMQSAWETRQGPKS